MADIARLGWQVEASGVDETRSGLKGIATEAAATARSFTAAGAAVAAAGEKIAGAPDGFLPFSVNADKAGKAIQRVDPHMKQLAKSGAAAAIGMADLGPAAGAAEHALQSLLLASGPVGLAMAALGVVIAFVASKFAEARENMADLAERGLKEVAKETENLKLEQTVRKEITALRALDPEIETIKTKYKELSQVEGISADLKEKYREAEALAVGKVVNARSLAAQKEKAANDATIEAERLKYDAIGLTGGALLAANIAIEENSRKTRIAADQSIDFVTAQSALAVSTLKLNEALAKIQGGKQGASDFQTSFGVNLDPQNKAAGDKLATLFGAGFTTFKNDRSKAQPLADAFKSMVEQGINLGLPNIGELISEKIGSANFERLRSGLGTDLKNALDASATGAKQWGETYRAEVVANADQMGTLGTALDTAKTKMEALEIQAAKKLALSLDTTQPVQGITTVTSMLDGIPNTTYKNLVINTSYAASPPRPFSEFMPYMERTFSKLTDLVDGSTPDINLAVKKPPAGSSVEGGKGRGSSVEGAEIAVHVDLTGATLSKEFLDAEMIPAIAKGINLATGKDAGFRVLS